MTLKFEDLKVGDRLYLAALTEDWLWTLHSGVITEIREKDELFKLEYERRRDAGLVVIGGWRHADALEEFSDSPLGAAEIRLESRDAALEEYLHCRKYDLEEAQKAVAKAKADMVNFRKNRPEILARFLQTFVESEKTDD